MGQTAQSHWTSIIEEEQYDYEYIEEEEDDDGEGDDGDQDYSPEEEEESSDSPSPVKNPPSRKLLWVQRLKLTMTSLLLK